MADGLGRAEACANIALAKYWGKSPRGGNLTAVPSLSLTLDNLRTRTEVRFSDDLAEDEALLDGHPAGGRVLARIMELLDRLRASQGETRRAQVVSFNDFPTAAGLASSASGFAALAMAASRALAAPLDPMHLSSLARQSSASAARSLFGGFVELGAETFSAMPVAPQDHWELTMLVAVVESGPKPVASTGGMIHTAATSPLYGAWVSAAPDIFAQVRRAVLERRFEDLASAVEQSALTMHATMLAARPPVVYFRGTTIELIDQLPRWRLAGLPLAFTMDAGPNVKVLTPSEHAAELGQRLREFPGVGSVIACRPGPAARLLELTGPLDTASPLRDAGARDGEGP